MKTPVRNVVLLAAVAIAAALTYTVAHAQTAPARPPASISGSGNYSIKAGADGDPTQIMCSAQLATVGGIPQMGIVCSPNQGHYYLKPSTVPGMWAIVTFINGNNSVDFSTVQNIAGGPNTWTIAANDQRINGSF